MSTFVNKQDFLYDSLMTSEKLKSFKLPDEPGVYKFLDSKGKILYIGKATSIRDRVRSYFTNDLLHARGKHIVDMVTIAHTITCIATESVLDALVLEASLIKRHQPFYNTKEKDNKSWNYVVITKEPYPRVFAIRERTMFLKPDVDDGIYSHIYGPFPQGGNIDVALGIIRKIFPFRSRCTPGCGKPCFDYQIGLCPGVCVGQISISAYKERIKEICMFFEGKKAQLFKHLETLMAHCAEKEEFEKAGEYKGMLFALRHIKDAALISDEVRMHSQQTAAMRAKPFRVEAYDVAHISGKFTVGVMIVVENGIALKSGYRKFKIRIDEDKQDDTLHLDEILRRRFAHKEWPLPDLIVVDGGKPQKNRAIKTLVEFSLNIPIVSVVKDSRHKPKAILGDKETALSYKRWILIANSESHRFALAYHRQLRDRIKTKKK